MANISAIKLPNGNTYDLVDKTSGFVTTDNKLEISSVSNGSYYPIVASNSTTAAIRQYDNTGFEYLVSKGTTSTRGYSRLALGNSTSVNNAGNKEGIIRLYGQYTGYADISLYTYSTSGRTITIPDASGTLALTSDIPTVPTNVSAFTNDAGYLTSFTETDPTVPSWAKASSKPSYNFSEIGSTPTTLSGYGITDASISSGVITLGSNTITPLTSSSTLSAAKLSGAIPSAVTATTQSASDNSTKIATTAYVTTAIANLPEPMIFKGSVGTNGTITSLPAAAAANEGFTYKVITALSTPVTAKVGDTVISNGSEWIVIPSGDEPSGTVTSVGLSNATNGGLTISGSPITSSGSITVGHSNVLTSAQTTQAVYPIKIDKNGHISAYGSAQTILALGTTSTTAAAGDHTHSYLPLSGGTLTGRVTTTNPINQVIIGTGTAGSSSTSDNVTTYYPSLWTFNSSITPTDGDKITVKIPVAGVTGGVYISLDNGTTYKPIAISGTDRLTTHYAVNTYLTLVYESSSSVTTYPQAGGTSTSSVTGIWRVANYRDANDNTVPQAQCTTSASTAAKTAIMTYYSASSNSYVMVNIRYSNTKAAALTLNINSAGAKPIYINGTVSSASNYTLPAGSYLVYYDGTNYYFRTDGKITGSITGDAATVGGYTVAKSVPSNAIFTDNNTTYTLSNALSSHKFTSTLTAGGSGSGTSTATMELVAGTGITLTDDTTNKKITIASSVTNTDTKLQVAAVTSGTTYYPIVGTGTSAATRQYDTTGLVYVGTNGTTSAVGSAKLTLGNSTASGTANNKQGQLVLYGSTAYAHTIQGAPTAARTLTLPNKTGTIALTSDIPANEIFVAEYDVTSYNDILSAYNAGKTIVAKYPDEDFTTDADFYYLTEANVTYAGEFAFVSRAGAYVVTIIVNYLNEWSTSGSFIPSITLNGSGVQSASFYAPTSAGTSGYVLTSNGSGAPSWSKSTATPTASTISKFDSSAKMNSTDMTAAQVDDFIDGLNVSGASIIQTATFTATSDANGWFQVPSTYNNTIIIWSYVGTTSVTERGEVLNNAPSSSNKYSIRFKQWDDQIIYKSSSKTINIWYINK